MRLSDQSTQHFISDSKGDLYQVSEEIANKYAALNPQEVAVVDHIDKETNTIWFTSPIPERVNAE